MCREQETYLVPKSTGTGRPKKRWKDGRNRNNYFMKMIIERMQKKVWIETKIQKKKRNEKNKERKQEESIQLFSSIRQKHETYPAVHADGQTTSSMKAVTRRM